MPGLPAPALDTLYRATSALVIVQSPSRCMLPSACSNACPQISDRPWIRRYSSVHAEELSTVRVSWLTHRRVLQGDCRRSNKHAGAGRGRHKAAAAPADGGLQRLLAGIQDGEVRSRPGRGRRGRCGSDSPCRESVFFRESVSITALAPDQQSDGSRPYIPSPASACKGSWRLLDLLW